MIISGEHVSDRIASCIAELRFDIAYMFFLEVLVPFWLRIQHIFKPAIATTVAFHGL